MIGYWARTWTPSAAPDGSNTAIAFSGWNDPAKAMQESEPLRKTLVGAKWIDAGGGNENGRWNQQHLSAWEAAISSGELQGWQGIVLDIEECDGGGLEQSFAAVLRAAKVANMSTLVTTSHSAPYSCNSALTLMQSFFNNTDVDYLSPQLYTSGGEAEPSFDAGNGVKWLDWVGAKGRFVPSLSCDSLKNGGYKKTQAYFAALDITASGYIMWPSENCQI